MGSLPWFRPLRADDDAVAAVAAGDVLLLLFVAAGARAAVVAVAASGATAVDLDAVTLAGDAVALTGAAAAVGGGSAVAGERRVGRRAVGAVGQAGAGGRDGRGGEVADDVLIVDVGTSEAGSKLLDVVIAVLSVEDVLGSVGRHGLGRNDLRDGKGATLGDVKSERAALGGSVLLGRVLG